MNFWLSRRKNKIPHRRIITLGDVREVLAEIGRPMTEDEFWVWMPIGVSQQDLDYFREEGYVSPEQ